MILLIDNAIPRDDATKLNDLIVDRKVPFFLNEVQTAFYDLEEQNVDSMPYMGHYALYNGEESEFCNILRDLGNHIIDNTDIFCNVKHYMIRINLGLKSYSNKHTGIHKDFVKGANFTMLYYINDSDGSTHFFNNSGEMIHTVTPKKGRAVIFNSDILHAASSPYSSHYRAIINYNFYADVKTHELKFR